MLAVSSVKDIRVTVAVANSYYRLRGLPLGLVPSIAVTDSVESQSCVSCGVALAIPNDLAGTSGLMARMEQIE